MKHEFFYFSILFLTSKKLKHAKDRDQSIDTDDYSDTYHRNYSLRHLGSMFRLLRYLLILGTSFLAYVIYQHHTQSQRHH